MTTTRIIEHVSKPPDPNAECRCGRGDQTGTVIRYSVVCPRHDGECYDVVEEVDDVDQPDT